MGICGMIQILIDKKCEEIVVFDVLVVEDIGDLFVLLIGEVIEIIIGVFMYCEKGGVLEILICGLGLFFGLFIFNGCEVINGSGDCLVNFNQFLFELINIVVIYKIQCVDFVEGGVVGMVNMEMVKLLEYGKCIFQVDGCGIWQEYDDWFKDKDGVGWCGMVSYIDQFDMGVVGKFGVFIGVQVLEGSNLEEMFFSSFIWVVCDGCEVVGVICNCIQVNGNQVVNGVLYYLVFGSCIYCQFIEYDKCDLQFVVLQWWFNDVVEVNLDYQFFKCDYIEDCLDLLLFLMMCNFNNCVVSDDGVLLYYIGSIMVDFIGNFLECKEEYIGGGFNVIFWLILVWMFFIDLFYFNMCCDQIECFICLCVGCIDVNGRLVGGIKNICYVDYIYDYSGDVLSIILDLVFDVNNLDNFIDLVLVCCCQQYCEYIICVGCFDVVFILESGFFIVIKGGLCCFEVIYIDYIDMVDVIIINVVVICVVNFVCCQDFLQDDFLVNVSGNIIDCWVSFDSCCLFKVFIGQDDIGLSVDLCNLVNNDVIEKISVLYLMGDYSVEWFGLLVIGNIGVCGVCIEVCLVGLCSGLDVVNNFDGIVILQFIGDFILQVFKFSNIEWLFSFNVVFELYLDLLLCVGVYWVMLCLDLVVEGFGCMFNLGEVDVEFSSVVDVLCSIIVIGNLCVMLLMLWNVDVLLEWYVNVDMMVFMVVYYKQFNGGLMLVIVDEIFDIDGQCVIVLVEQLVISDQKSDLFGVEFIVLYSFFYLLGIFFGLGVKVSYNYVDFNFKIEDLCLGEFINFVIGVVILGIVELVNIFGLFRYVVLVQVYWGLGKLDLQVIYKYCLDYYQQFVGDLLQNCYVWDNGVLDFCVIYKVNKYLLVLLLVSNFIDELWVLDMFIFGSFCEYIIYGWCYYLGVCYCF